MSHIGKKIDDVDIKIISFLRENCRMNASAIASQLGMSVSAVIDRIKKLEKSGVIKQYSLILDTNQVGLDVCAFVEVSTGDQSYLDALAKIKKFVDSHPEIVECHSVTGTSMFIMKVYTSSMSNLEHLLGELQTTDNAIQTKSSIVLNTIKQESFANLEDILG